MYEDEQGHLSRENAVKFLKDFAVASGVNFNQELADRLISTADKENKGYLEYHGFQKLFFSVAQKENMSLTQSLQMELDDNGEVVKTQPIEFLLKQPSAAAHAELEDVWAVVSEALQAFFKRGEGGEGLRKSTGLGSTAAEWMGVYSTVYSFCSSHSSDAVGLYKRLQTFLRERATSLTDLSRSQISSNNNGFDLLKFYLVEWDIYKNAARRTNSILKVLNKFVSIKLPTQLSVIELCWSQWESFFMFPLQNELVSSFKALVSKEKKSEEEVAEIKRLLESVQTLDLPLEEVEKEVDIKPYLSLLPPKPEESISLTSSNEVVSEQPSTN